MTMLTGEHYAECLDRAAKILGGHRQVQLEYPSNWDLWYFPEDKLPETAIKMALQDYEELNNCITT